VPTRRLLVTLVSAAALIAPGVALAAPAPTHTGIGIRLLDAPQALINDPRAHSYIVDSLKPGATITRHVLVNNDTGRPAHLLLYVAASSIENGQFTPGSRGSTNELTSWTSLTPTTMDLPQGGSAKATITVRVPKNAGGGERYATVIADLPPTAGGQGIKVESRVGIRMYLNVAGKAAPRTDFSIDTLTAERDKDGAPVVQAQVHNIGDRAIDLNGALTLDHGPGGLSAGPFPAELGTTLAPGQSEPVTVKLDKALPAGPWHARIDLRSGLIHRAAEGTITFPSGAGSKAAPVKAKAVPLTKNRHVLIPIAIGLILALLIGLILFFLFKRRRRREDEEEQGKAGPGTSPMIPGQRASNDQAVRK